MTTPRTLGSPTTSPFGPGGPGMSEFSGPGDEQESVAAIGRAPDLGVTRLDTADRYGPFTGKRLVSRAVAGRHDEVVPATGFGTGRRPDGSRVRTDGTPGYVRAARDASLQRLGALTEDDLARLDQLTPVGVAAGDRYPDTGSIDR